MDLMDIIKPLSTAQSSAVNKSQQHQGKDSRERQESNLGLLGEKQVSYLCAMQQQHQGKNYVLCPFHQGPVLPPTSWCCLIEASQSVSESKALPFRRPRCRDDVGISVTFHNSTWKQLELRATIFETWFDRVRSSPSLRFRDQNCRSFGRKLG